MLTDAEQQRLTELSGPTCSVETAREMFGLDLEGHDLALTRLFRAWVARRGGHDPVAGGQVNRRRLELYLSANNLIPRELAASRMGMNRGSLEAIIDRMAGDGWLASHLRDVNVVSASFESDLLALVAEAMTARGGSHSDKCRRLHVAVKAVLGVDVEPQWCVTARRLGEAGVYAYDRDVLNGDPISLKYRVWLDLGKPVMLPPDAVSLALYARGSDALTRFLAPGVRPDVPPVLLPAGHAVGVG